MIDCITRNKKLAYVPYPRWLGIILARDEGYIDNHGIIIPIPALSLKIINVAHIDGEKNITQIMANWMVNPYINESLILRKMMMRLMKKKTLMIKRG